MKPEGVLFRLGGVADAKMLQRFTSRAKVRAALARGTIVRDARGRYSLPSASAALRAQSRLSAVVSHSSAAAVHGWEIKHPPARPIVTVPRNRKVTPERREGVDVRWHDLRPDEVLRGRVTSYGRTVMDCAKDMPFDEALAIADSALRHGHVTKAHLLQLAEAMPARHRARCLRVARAADGRAANPFESVLRAIALDVPGLEPEPQVVISGPGFSVRPDLVDERRRVVAEADSFEWHGTRSALRADCRRYNMLALHGWLVLRFSWEDVMFASDLVRRCLVMAAERQPQEHALGSLRGHIPA
jgi:very-short-patch-repair endonuclease